MEGDAVSTLWELKPHTHAKHELLRKYLGAWFPILGSWNRRIVFLDGFAGPGIYEGGEAGSPILALRTLLDHGYLARMPETEFLFLFCEKDEKRAASLDAQIARLKAERSPWPEKVVTEVIAKPFDEVAAQILDSLGAESKNLAPTFAFIDPFGFAGLPMNRLRDLLLFNKCELFVNLMVDRVNQFATAANADDHLRDLFGCDDFRDVVEAPPGGRTEYLKDLYKRQLHDVCTFKYVLSFAMKYESGHIGYYLLHGSRNIKAAEKMKDAMWTIDPGGGCLFSDKMAGVDVLFLDEPDFGPLRNGMLDRFAGMTVGIERLEEWVIADTPYRKAHLRAPVLAHSRRSSASSWIVREGVSSHAAPASPSLNSHQRSIRHLVPCTAVEFSASRLGPNATPLFEEERDLCRATLITQVPRPFRVHRSRAGTTLAASNDPVDPNKVNVPEWA